MRVTKGWFAFAGSAVLAILLLGFVPGSPEDAGAYQRHSRPALHRIHRVSGHRRHKSKTKQRTGRHRHRKHPGAPTSPGSSALPTATSGAAVPPAAASPASGQAAPSDGPAASPTVPDPVAGLPALFSSDSVWNKPLVDDAPLDPGSAAMAGGLNAEVAREEGLGTGPWITPDADIYIVGRTQPTVLVHLDDPTASWRIALQAAFSAVPIPPALSQEAMRMRRWPSGAFDRQAVGVLPHATLIGWLACRVGRCYAKRLAKSRLLRRGRMAGRRRGLGRNRK